MQGERRNQGIKQAFEERYMPLWYQEGLRISIINALLVQETDKSLALRKSRTFVCYQTPLVANSLFDEEQKRQGIERLKTKNE